MIPARFSTVVSAIAAFALIVTLAAGIFSIPSTSRGAPVIAVILTVAVAATGVAIYDYNSCDVNLVWGCNSNGGSTGGGASGPGGGLWQGQGNEPAETGNPQTQNENAQGAGGAVGEICNSAPNACGMVSTGFINQNGQ